MCLQDTLELGRREDSCGNPAGQLINPDTALSSKELAIFLSQCSDNISLSNPTRMRGWKKW
jgi:hypothetical protein